MNSKIIIWASWDSEQEKNYRCFSILWYEVYLLKIGKHGTSDYDTSWCGTFFWKSSSAVVLFRVITISCHPFIKMSSVCSLLYSLCVTTVIVAITCAYPHKCHLSCVGVIFSLVQRFISIIFLNLCALTTTICIKVNALLSLKLVIVALGN